MQLDNFINQQIVDGLFPAIDILYAVGDKVVLRQQWGEIGSDNLFDLASLTKPIAVATLLMKLVADGKLDLDDKVQKYLPEFTGKYKSEVSLRMLASHISGLPATVKLYKKHKNLADARHDLLTMALEYQPQTKMIYSCLGYLILTEILQKITGQTLADLFQIHIAMPLNMLDSAFSPLKYGVSPNQITPTHSSKMRGVVHDGNARFFNEQGGNAGLFSTSSDMHRFAIMLLNESQPLNSAAFFNNQNPPNLTPRSIGWELNTQQYQATSCGENFPIGSIGHTGFTGTSMWLNPQTKQVLIALSNRVYLSHDANIPAMVEFRKKLHGFFETRI